MQGKLLNDNEKVGNICLLAFICVVSVVGCSAVMLFLNGGIRELVFPLGGVAAIIVKIFEKKLGKLCEICVCIYSTDYWRDYELGM